MNKYFILATLLLTTSINAAVHINDEQTGEVVLLPFYTVANGLNTYINISNHTINNKIIRVVLREGIGSKRVMSLNVFLNRFDSWTATLGVNDNKAVFTSTDDSCTSLANNNIHDLWTHEVDTDPQTPLTDEELLARIGAGWIEIYEMATVANEQVTLSTAIQSRDCGFLQQQYQAGGIWETDLNQQLSATQGGIHGSATLIDVHNGFMTQTPATHFADFYPAGTLAHTGNEAELPDLSSADTTSILIHDGQAITTSWPTGYQAISALLMKTKIKAEYNIDPAIGAWTEWVMTMPTLRFYQDIGGAGPFIFNAEGQFAFPEPFCRNGIKLYGRSGSLHGDESCIDISPAPPGVNEFPVSVLMLSTDNLIRLESDLVHAEADNTALVSYFRPYFYAGVAEFDFTGFAKPTLNSSNPNDPGRMKYTGFPVIGFSYTRFINANAQPGLLANYGSAEPYWHQQSITAE